MRTICFGLGVGAVLAVATGIIGAGRFDGLDLAFLVMAGALVYVGLRGA